MNGGLLGKESSIVNEITIEELVDYIELLIWEKGIEYFKVTESFNKQGAITYIVMGLHMEIEDTIVCCSDYDSILLNNNCVLMAFLKSQVTVQYVIDLNGLKYVKINFANGNVIIETI